MSVGNDLTRTNRDMAWLLHLEPKIVEDNWDSSIDVDGWTSSVAVGLESREVEGFDCPESSSIFLFTDCETISSPTLWSLMVFDDGFNEYSRYFPEFQQFYQSKERLISEKIVERKQNFTSIISANWSARKEISMIFITISWNYNLITLAIVENFWLFHQHQTEEEVNITNQLDLIKLSTWTQKDNTKLVVVCHSNWMLEVVGGKSFQFEEWISYSKNFNWISFFGRRKQDAYSE